MPSRILQIVDTQRAPILVCHFQSHQHKLHARVVVEGDTAQVRRIGMLLWRTSGVESVVWYACGETDIQQTLDATAVSLWSAQESDLLVDEDAAFWRVAPSVVLRADAQGKQIPEHNTEVRQRWTDRSLYMLFLCSYEELHLRSSAAQHDCPTPLLWEHDVAEVFVGLDQEGLDRYCEFEMSPRAEWIDLAIHAAAGEVLAASPLASGFRVAAAIDRDRKQWTGVMRIPRTALGCAQESTALRMNLFRSQGSRPVELAWRPTFHRSFHVPARFGRLLLTRHVDADQVREQA